MGPHVIRNAGHPGYCSTYLELFTKRKDGELTRIGEGTGFFYRIGSLLFLVTNWHVVTGRHPEMPGKLLVGYPNSPTHFRLHIPHRSNLNHFIPGEMISLYDDDQLPVWLETPALNDIDLIMIPIKFSKTNVAPPIQDFAPYKDRILVPGVDVVVIGFPFGRNKTNPFPIWKRAMVASEPAYTIDGKFYAYLDTPGRPGMSGSPVYAISDGFETTYEEKLAIESATKPFDQVRLMASLGDRVSKTVPVLEFVGVYSGSYGDQRLDQLNLGRFWPVGVLAGHEDRLVKGQNPYPPFDN